MESENHTDVSEFFLLGFSESSEIQLILFGLLLFMYLVISTGNLLIILVIISETHLHKPMYFFLSNLSYDDFGFASTTTPKMLVNIWMENKVITYAGCLIQIYFSSVFACLDSILLTAMACDCYVSIYHPLHYMIIMIPWLCGWLVLVCCFLSFIFSLLQTLMILRISFCKHIEIPYYFCDPSEVLKLTCSDTLINNVFMYFMTSVLGIFPLTGILYSYSQIVSSILRISSSGGQHKAFSTCGSHLSVVSLYCGTGLGVYLCSAATPSSKTSLVISVLYTMVTPMMNPFIYSLRNREMKGALGRLLGRVAASK